MKIWNKRELQQITFDHLSDIDFKVFMNLYKKCTVKPYYFLYLPIDDRSSKNISIIIR